MDSAYSGPQCGRTPCLCTLDTPTEPPAPRPIGWRTVLGLAVAFLGSSTLLTLVFLAAFHPRGS